MAFRVGFWNINMGPTSFSARKQAFSLWCHRMQPDLLCLEEDSFTSPTDPKLFGAGFVELQLLSGMAVLNFVQTLDINGNGCGKNLVALTRVGNPLGFAARPLQFPTFGVGDAKRMLLKVTQPTGLELWIIHANASASGGRTASQAVSAYLNSVAGAKAIVGGDFNYPISSWGVDLKGFWPLDWSGNAALFTQWGKDGNVPTTDQGYAALRLARQAHKPFTVGIAPHEVIDYAVSGKDRVIKSETSMAYEDWWSILTQFDHAPVLYQVG